MNRARLLLASAAIALACDNPVDVPRETQGARPPRFVLFGVVRDEEGLPLPGASAEVYHDGAPGSSALSNEKGYFSFKEVTGWLTVRVWKDGYDHVRRFLTVEGDLAFEVMLTRLDAADSIRLGRTIRTTVNPNAPPCDPIGWDARAPCRRLAFTAPSTGWLTIAVAWFGGSPLDIVITRSDGTYVAYSRESNYEEATVETCVEAGMTYEVRVSSYYDPQVFNLTANLAPAC